MTVLERFSDDAPDFTKVPLSLEQWARVELAPKDVLLGELMSTTSRLMMS